MVKVNNINSPQLVEAVLLWTGWGRNAVPLRDDSLLASHFGDELASKLLKVIKSLEDDFYASDARFAAADLEEMEKLSVAEFKGKHPAVADEISKAFSWCYTFDFK